MTSTTLTKAIDYSDETPDLTFTHDRVGRAKQVMQGSGPAYTSLIDYTAAGQVWGESFNGLWITNAFDNLFRHRAIGLMGQAATTVQFGYDGASRLQKVTNGAYRATYSFVANSPLVEQIMFNHSASVRMTTTKAYDKLNRLRSITSVAGSTVGSSYTYNTANQRTRQTQADGSYWVYEYDSLGQVKSGRKYWSDGTPVAGQQFDYGFDEIGNRSSTKTGGDSQGANQRSATYTADRLNRYTQRTVPGYVEVIGAAHVQATVSVNSQPAERKREYFRREIAAANSSTNAWLNLVTSATWGTTNESQTGKLFVPKTPEVFQYDMDGNLTNDGRWVYNWDAENRITQMISTNVVDGARKKLNFEYDYQGRRTRKTVSDPSGATWQVVQDHRFVYGGWNLVAELNATNNAVVRSYMWGTDLSGTTDGAGGVGGLLAVNDSIQGLHFTAYDGNGNIVALVKGSDGTVSATYEYGPFGELIRAGGPMARVNPFLFSTKYTDDESDLVYYGYRYYNPSTGRWLSRDPIQEDGGRNLYQFVYNNPAGYYDYLGREGYWNDVGTTYSGMGQGAANVGRELGYFAGDLLLGFVAVVVPDCCCESLLTKLDGLGYKGSALTGSAGQDGGLKTSGKVFIAPVVAAVSVPVNAYESVEAALNGDFNAAGQSMGEGLATAGLLAAPFSKGPGGTGGYTGGGTLGEAVYNLSPTLFGELPAATRANIIRQANRTCESSLIKNMGSDAVSQFQIYPRLPSGRLATWWYTADGVCTRGGLQIREFKASPTAPLTGNQPAALPLIEQFGGGVRSLKGDGIGLPQGTVLPPIRVQVIRQNQFQANELVLPALGNGGSR